MLKHDRINYIEFPCRDIPKTRRFFESCFGWTFEDYGPDYSSFSDGDMAGGFFKSELASTTASGGTLVVLYSARLEESQSKVVELGGTIAQPIFAFPGGRRFHFIEPSGNELAVWSDAE